MSDAFIIFLYSRVLTNHFWITSKGDNSKWVRDKWCLLSKLNNIFPHLVSALELFPPSNSFRTFMYCDLWPYLLWPLDFQIQKRIVSAETTWENMVSDWNSYVYNFQMFCVLLIGAGQDITFGLEWINGTYANNFSILKP